MKSLIPEGIAGISAARQRQRGRHRVFMAVTTRSSKNFTVPGATHGIRVDGSRFRGPGQGGALRQGIYLTHEWERFAKAVLDHFRFSEWTGSAHPAEDISRFARRLRTTDQPRDLASGDLLGPGMTLKQMTPGKDKYWSRYSRPVTEKAWKRSWLSSASKARASTGASPKACTSPAPRRPSIVHQPCAHNLKGACTT